MESFGRRSPVAVCLFVALTVLLLTVPVERSYAQAELKWLDVGDLAHQYTSTGSYGIAGSGMIWPYIKGSTGNIQGYHDGFELWIGARDWTDEDGEEWPYKIAYTSQDNMGQSVFPQRFETISKYPDPHVEVDLLEDYRVRSDIDKVDPDLPADRMILNEVNTNLGIKLTKRIYAFSQEHHDDYHVIEMVLTNTGNVDGDEEVELPGQTVEDVYLWWDRRWGQSWKTSDVVGITTRWGRENMHDIVRDADLRANYTWNGLVADFSGGWDSIGAPAVESSGSSFPSGQDTTGRLHAIGYASTFALHADRSTEDRSDDVNQPVTMWWHDANAAQFTGTDETNVSQMEEHYGWFESGIADPFQAYEIESSGDFAHQNSAQYKAVAQAGVRVAHAYGPYTLGPGDSVRVVVGEAVAGLPYDAALEIGRKYKRLWEQGDQYGDIWYDANHDGVRQEEEVMDKNEWAIDAARDSVLHVIRRAMANYDSGFDIPQPPPPPTRFIVASAAGGVSMDWEYPYEDPEGGFEIYRAKNFFSGTVEEDYEYQKIAELEGDRRSYKDTSNVNRGVDYFYYITAIGEVNDDPTGMTPTGTRLRSSRYYTQTYTAATGLRTPGEALSDIRIVPNPFHVGASANLRYPGAERIGFLDIPGECTIKIYTERGDLVKTIEHTDGTGDEFWNLQTEAQQMLVSGLYIAAIEDHTRGGETVMKKFIVVR